MGFTTVPDALRSAGRAGQTAVDEIRGADCGTPVNGVAAALPGTKAAGASGEFASSWTATLTTWCNDAGEHAAALGKAADTYIAGDEHARDTLPDEHKMHGPR
ncbi:type VII secretion target [Amycolatopsis nivea]